jgi:hypothetical protein
MLAFGLIVFVVAVVVVLFPFRTGPTGLACGSAVRHAFTNEKSFRVASVSLDSPDAAARYCIHPARRRFVVAAVVAFASLLAVMTIVVNDRRRAAPPDLRC